ncbi:hypothetical protein BGY98DRAFT_966330 [Russula aff. rugulosa BPL654]|nr:hypothetical protein BGY98DRAFT_966330 [Russula aff. rugulosa BPL654]
MRLATSRTPNDASGILAWRLLKFLSSKRPSAQEKLGNRRLDEARDLAQKNEDLISPSDLKIAKDKLLHAAEIRIGLESRSGFSRFLQARQYRRSAKEALGFVKTVSKRVQDEILGQRPMGLNSMLATTDGGIDLRLCAVMKPKVSTLVEHLYQFKTSSAPESIRSNVELAKVLLKDMNFIYPEARDREKRYTPYSHPIIQQAVNATLFRNRDDAGVVYHEHFSPMPIPVIALVLTVVQWCIDEWSDGQQKDSSWDERTLHGVYSSHISSLFSFQAQGLERNIDVLCQLQCDLLRNAR